MAGRVHRDCFAIAVMVMGLLGLLAAAASGQGSPSAQKLTSKVSLYVADPAGAGISHATVTFKGEVTVTRQTAEDGSVHLTLPYGHYAVTIACRPFKTLDIADFIVDVPAVPPRYVGLQLGGNGGVQVSGPVQLASPITSDLPNSVREKLPDASTPNTFTSPDGTFRITYPDLLIRCERVREKNGLTYSYFWGQPGCSAYIPPCSNADADDQPLLCLAYPPKEFADTPTFGAATLTVGETNQSEKECLAGAGHSLKPIIIRGVKFTGTESADAASGHYRNSRSYTAYHNGKCYGLAITVVTTSGANFDPPVKEFNDWDKVDRPLKKARDSFEFLK